jgi:glutamine amidotransferase
MIGLVDYGLGNIQAFTNIYRSLGIDVMLARTPTDLQRCSKIILPGVGAFDWAMTRLNHSGMREALDCEVIHAKKPVLGVCVGLQMMANSSEEGELAGLGWIDSKVIKFDSNTLSTKTHLPHMGWNDVKPKNTEGLFLGIGSPRYYFLHSYYIKTACSDDVLATTNYGIEFTSAVRFGNIYGTQFHPEKSHQWGIQLLKNFADSNLC